MSKTSISAASVAETAGTEAEPIMFKVTLKSVVSLHGMLYKPGQDITVNEAILKAMGDAVDHAKQV